MKLSRRKILVALSAAIAVGGTAGVAAPDAPPLSADDRRDVARVVDYLQALSSARSRFVQTDARGAQTEGTFYLQRPGRARIEYDPPSGLTIAADGRNVTEVDRRLKTKHVYSLSSTPLELILAPKIQLDRGVVVRQVAHDPGSVTLVVEAAHRKGRIALTFSDAPLSLTGWALEDGRGGATKVRLAGLTHTPPYDAGFFELPRPSEGGAINSRVPVRTRAQDQLKGRFVRLRIASWNVNSVRLRTDHIARFAAGHAPDVLCLQEIKCQEEGFPGEALAEAGFPHVKIRGQKGWHGVALASRLPIEDAPALDLCREGHARCVSGLVAGIEILNLYIPAGGDVPDRSNPKFDHKLDFYERLTTEMLRRRPEAPLVLAGDLNVAPGEHDVWNHRFMSKVVSHTPVEVAAMQALQDSLGFIDPVRETVPEPAKLFSWWSYRAVDFRASNRGLRLDHIWITPALRAAAARSGASAARIHDDVRAWERPSDHAPVTIDLDI